jgi:hypothetical protein
MGLQSSESALSGPSNWAGDNITRRQPSLLAGLVTAMSAMRVLLKTAVRNVEGLLESEKRRANAECRLASNGEVRTPIYGDR